MAKTKAPNLLVAALALSVVMVGIVVAQQISAVRIEPEDGNLTGTARSMNSSSASDGGFLTFENVPSVVRRFPGDPNPKLYQKSYWGSSIGGNADPARHEDPTGVSLSIRRTFWQCDDATNLNGKMYNAVADDLANNRLPFISIKTPGWQALADGGYDAQLDAMFRRLDSYGKPVWFVVHHEPEGGGGNNFPDDPGGPTQWRRMQQKMRARMDAVNTQNVAFMPILMSFTWESASGRNPEDWWVPNVWDAYCVDHYRDNVSGNMFTNGAWNAFVTWVEAKGLPFCIGEWGNRGTDAQAAQEMRDFWNWSFNNNKDMLAYTYFDSGLNSPNGSWELLGEPLILFRDILKNDSRVQRINDL